MIPSQTLKEKSVYIRRFCREWKNLRPQMNSSETARTLWEIFSGKGLRSRAMIARVFSRKKYIERMKARRKTLKASPTIPHSLRLAYPSAPAWKREVKSGRAKRKRPRKKHMVKVSKARSTTIVPKQNPFLMFSFWAR